MAERALRMYAHEVRATLDNRQTMFRRVMKQQPPWDHLCSANDRQYGCLNDGISTGWVVEKTGEVHHHPSFESIRCPYGVPGDKLRMLSTWAVHRQYDNVKPTQLPRDMDFVWTAWLLGGKPDVFGKLRPGRFCPVWMRQKYMPLAENQEVRVQRVQEISKEDAIAEGIGWNRFGSWRNYASGLPRYIINPTESFQTLWDSINGKKHPWDSDDWVWAVTFKRLTER